MGRKRPLKYRDLRRKLAEYGIEEDKRRGKGSHRIFKGVVQGRIVTYPTRCHSENDEKPVPVIEAIRRAFRLSEVDGVTDEQFYGT